MTQLFLYCRPGFETEVALECQQHCADAGVSTTSYPGYVICQSEMLIDGMQQDFEQFIFARQWFEVLAHLTDLNTKDRVSAIVGACDALKVRVDEVFIETPDTDLAKVLSPLCRGINKPLLKALQAAGKLQANSPWRLHLCFTATNEVYIGVADRRNSSPWPQGIPRLKFPQDAPSRSTLKLEEAIVSLIDPKSHLKVFDPGRRAIDLGAAPGGWTYQLVKRGLLVIAVDNGKMDPVLMATEMVQHVRADGFTYKPQRPVDWMVCDIIGQPIRIAELVARWFANGWCQHCIFNLKLPMKQRFAEVQKCFALIDKQLQAKKTQTRRIAKQLYHDRDEITVYIHSE
ncbi:MAG: 23S rRNA (cytidine(2498)-2'-O)-methyltransferase RlmM [Gammaproteobacteria bacterium]|nr:23S rRNA (cytidine(2498)-2'-O)-methyltransferase RlmM [Gammaproteobacteria bacterium]